jgi:hypothetical protein
MPCYICGGEAVERCYGCGQLICEQHGKKYCERCQSGYVSGDPRRDRYSVEPTPASSMKAWWRPKPAEDYEPPACAVCKGLTRRRCYNCGSYFCAEHGTEAGLCLDCNKSSLIGCVIGLVILIFLIGILAFEFLFQSVAIPN